MPTVTLSAEQLRSARISRAHIMHLMAAGATRREHFDLLDGVPVGLARKALRYRRARRRADRLSGSAPHRVGRFRVSKAVQAEMREQRQFLARYGDILRQTGRL